MRSSRSTAWRNGIVPWGGLEGMASRQAAENMTLHETRQLRACLAAFEDKFRKEGLGGVFR